VDTGRAPQPARSERELLVEAVTLLTQHQAELERRVEALETRLAELQRSVGGDADERVVQLRGQVERLSARAQTQAQTTQTTQPTEVGGTPASQLPATSPPAKTSNPPAKTTSPSLEQRVATSFTLDRAGLVFIGAGVVALVYAVFTQIHP
jgi:hypothetical protein